MTVFATGADPATCRARLKRIERNWLERLGFIADDDTADTP